MTTIVLPDRCDRGAADALLPDLLATVGSGPVLLDGSGVRQVGQAMLQLLLSARRTVDAAIVSPSSTLVEAAQMAGLAAELFEDAH